MTRRTWIAAALAALVGALIGLAVASLLRGSCVYEAFCASDGSGGCLPNPCEQAFAWQVWLLPLGAALLLGGIVTAAGGARGADDEYTDAAVSG